MAKAKKKSDPTWVVFTADWHVNSTLGLVSGVLELDDGGSYKPSPDQEWLWKKWREFWAGVGESEGRKVSVVCGDVVESFHHGTVQIITLNQAVELEAAVLAAQPMLEVVDETWVVRGTEAHVGGAGFKEELFAKRIGAKPDQTGRYSFWHLAHEWQGVKFDVAHHPGTSSHRKHTQDWAPPREATDVCLAYDEDHVDRPDVVVRGHAHYLGRGFHRDTLCVFLPPWLFCTSYAYRRGAGRKVEPPGGVVFRCEDGNYSWKAHTFLPPRNRPW